MKLFSGASRQETAEANIEMEQNQSRVALVSTQKKLLDDIASVLSMHNFNSCTLIQQNFFVVQDDALPSNLEIAVVDIGDTTDVNTIIERMDFIVPMYAKCVFVGNTDSIAFAQEVTRRGAAYLHIGTQLWELPEVINSFGANVAYTSDRNAVKISVLGCKGGIGNSLMSYQLLQIFGQLSSIPMLLVQGSTGSSDIDLIMNRPLPHRDGQITPIGETLSVKNEPKDQRFRYEDPQFKLFNIIIFDQQINAVSREEIETILTNTQTIVLMISHNLASLRVAKILLDEHERQKSTGHSVVQRIFVCLNEHAANMDKVLTIKEMSDFLGRKIDLVNPYQNSKKNDVIQFTSSVFKQFAEQILGRPSAGRGKTGSSAMKGLTSFFKKNS